MTQVRLDSAPEPAGLTAGGSGVVPRRRRRYSVLTRRDKMMLTLMVGIPLILDMVFIWGPAIASVIFSFTNWNGIHGLSSDNFVGIDNYTKLVTSYAPFWEGVKHNIIWFAVLM